jgi:hypothetical protein
MGSWYSNCTFVFYKLGALILYIFTFECYFPSFILLFLFSFYSPFKLNFLFRSIFSLLPLILFFPCSFLSFSLISLPSSFCLLLSSLSHQAKGKEKYNFVLTKREIRPRKNDSFGLPRSSSNNTANFQTMRNLLQNKYITLSTQRPSGW